MSKKCLGCKKVESECKCAVFDMFDRAWITRNAKEVLSRYDYGVLTIRSLHYQLVSLGMINTQRHYKRIVSAMIKARWNGEVSFEQFSDHDRETLGETQVEETDVESSVSSSKYYIKYWMEHYKKNRWENQDYYIEVFIEKKALQGVFEKICNRNNLALSPCKGYPSLTFLNDAANRFKEQSKKCIILYFGDYDPSGEDIPRSIQEVLYNMGAEVHVERILLMEEQVVEMNLPPAPAKKTDSRTASWDGLGQVELDAVKPEIIERYLQEAIDFYFDEQKYTELLEQEGIEREQYKTELKEYAKTL